ncbi:MAG: hypothetical protein GXO76_15885, partial [Calditrichaeota bacterium]|nr:hypothetical protein [Calditrichota bacterium]
GSWLLGNNPAGAVMYDSKTGRCFDGIVAKETINRNSGAESTIEALLTLQALQNNAISRTYLFFSNRSEKRTVQNKNGQRLVYRCYSNGKGKEIFVYLNLSNGRMNVLEPDAWNRMINPKNHDKNGGI